MLIAIYYPGRLMLVLGLLLAAAGGWGLFAERGIIPWPFSAGILLLGVFCTVIILGKIQRVEIHETKLVLVYNRFLRPIELNWEDIAHVSMDTLSLGFYRRKGHPSHLRMFGFQDRGMLEQIVRRAANAGFDDKIPMRIKKAEGSRTPLSLQNKYAAFGIMAAVVLVCALLSEVNRVLALSLLAVASGWYLHVLAFRNLRPQWGAVGAVAAGVMIPLAVAYEGIAWMKYLLVGGLVVYYLVMPKR